MKNCRRGSSLIEVIIVFSVIFLLTGLLLGAIQNARMHASRQVGMNKVRQILLATHHYASLNNDFLPNTLGQSPAVGRSVSEALGPYLDASSTSPQRGPHSWRLSSDPSLASPPQASGAPLPVGATNTPGDEASSLAVNPMVYAPRIKLSSSITDG